MPISGENYTTRTLTDSDFGWLSTWFRDRMLDREVGPFSLTWFTSILSENDTVNLVVESDIHGPVAVVRCLWATREHDPHVVAFIAVRPDLRRTGAGTRALTTALTWPGHPRTSHWVAVVLARNVPAAVFFLSCGWAFHGVTHSVHLFALKVRHPNTAGAHRTYNSD